MGARDTPSWVTRARAAIDREGATLETLAALAEAEALPAYREDEDGRRERRRWVGVLAREAGQDEARILGVFDEQSEALARIVTGQRTRVANPEGPLPKLRDSLEVQHPLTELGNRDRLVARHGQDLRYVPGLGWIGWDGRRWESNVEHVAVEAAAETVRALARDALDEEPSNARRALIKHALKSESERALRAMVRLAESHPRMRLAHAKLDSDPLILNAQNGRVNLQSGKLIPHRREAFCSKIVLVDYDPEAKAPRWDAFLEEVIPDPEVRAFLQRWCGYCLTGDASEQVLVFNHGEGENGKGVFESMQRAIMGDYASAPAFDTFLVRRSGSASNDLADLKGVRLASASEPEEGGRLGESMVKRMTGEDPITARHLYQEFVTFLPVCKLQLTGNHRPRIRGTDHAMWRRILLVPWVVTIKKRDPRLKTKLRFELRGILAWAVRGCMEWQRTGLCPPDAVVAAVAEYREAEDHVGRFLSDCCRVEPGLCTTSSDLRLAYTNWCTEEGERPLTARALGPKLKRWGIVSGKVNRKRGWLGVGAGTRGTHGHVPGGTPPHTRAEGSSPISSSKRPTCPTESGSQAETGVELSAEEVLS